MADIDKKGKWTQVWWLALLPLLALVFAEVGRDWLPAVDGPYQTAGACRQILAGNCPGSDFVVFHGLLTMWYHAGFYALFGGTVAGSVTAYVLACLVVVCLPVYLLFRLMGWSAGRARVWALLVVNAALLVPPPVFNGFFPGGNMLGTRVSLALSVALAVAWALKHHSLRGFKAGLLIGLVPSLGLLISQEQGMALGGAVLATLGWYFLLRRRIGFGHLMQIGLGSFLSFITVYLAGCFLLTGGNPQAYWSFAWGEVPANQFWFFGKPPECIASWRDLLDVKKLLLPAACLLAVWGAAIFLLWRQGLLAGGRGAVVLFLFAYALLVLHPLAGYKHAHYFSPGLHAGLIVLAWALIPRLESYLASRWSGRIWLLGGLLAMVAGGLQLAKPSIKSALGKGDVEPEPMVLVASPAFAGMVAPVGEAERVRRWVDYVGEDARVWSMWSGPLEEALGQAPSSRFDYVIYALSEESEADYVRRFREFAPTHVVTGRESSGHIFQWMMKRYWPIYRELLREFRPVAAVNARVLWERRPSAPSALLEEAVPIELSGEGARARLEFSIEAEAEEVSVYEVRLRYRLVEGPLPLLSHRLARISLKARGVPAWREIGMRVKPEGEWTEFRFPVMALGPRQVTLMLEALSPAGAPNLEIEQADLIRLTGGEPEAALMMYDDRFLLK